MGTTTGHRIAEAARRSGFPAASLRYYEQIGLMPPTARTAAGYRAYTDRDIDRLRFIGRAKQLGCTLEEITELAAAWDHDECAPVQHRLASLVGTKIAETQARIAELVQLAAELQATAASLARAPVDGPCGDACGCMTLVDDGPVPVALGPKPIACTLGADQVGDRMAEWRAALRHALERTPIEGGVRVALGADVPVAEVVRLAAAEHGCCRFFSFAVTVDDRGVALEVTAPPEAADVVAALFGRAA